MKTIRIIPRLDIKGPNLVKGIHMEGLRVLGKPEEFADFYYQEGADELFYQDVVASLYGRNSLHEIVSRTAKKSFIPLIVGGGIRNIDDIRSTLRAGADKVCINTAAIKEPDLIRRASKKFGSSTIMVAIEAIRQQDGQYLAFIDNGRDYTGLDVLVWAKQVEQLGAGEIIISSVDQEGTGKGYNIELTKSVSKAVSIPVIAHGGAGSVDDIYKVVKEGFADAVAVASLLHYSTIETRRTVVGFESEGNTTFLESGKRYNQFEYLRIEDIKTQLNLNKLSCRV
ncbi:MAG: imidazole glycerol phosphate synthase cyclase subunit [Pseudomonadota bacterium]